MYDRRIVRLGGDIYDAIQNNKVNMNRNMDSPNLRMDDEGSTMKIRYKFAERI